MECGMNEMGEKGGEAGGRGRRAQLTLCVP